MLNSIASVFLARIPMVFFQLFSNNPEFIDVPAGMVLFSEGDPGGAMYVLVSGTAQVSVQNRVVETLSTGSIIGEMGLVSPAPRSATVRATADARFVEIDESRFQFLVQQTPFFATQVMRVMAERLRAADRIIAQQEATSMSDRIFNVLFVCTGNSTRSILAEAILNHAGKGRFRGFSAGLRPTGEVNPMALELLQQQKLPVSEARSKSWHEFAQPGAPALDFIITLCGSAADEAGPNWPGQAMTASWVIEDPNFAEGDDETKRFAVSRAFRLLNQRIGSFVSLPLAKLDVHSLQRKLDDIGDENPSSK